MISSPSLYYPIEIPSWSSTQLPSIPADLKHETSTFIAQERLIKDTDQSITTPLEVKNGLMPEINAIETHNALSKESELLLDYLIDSVIESLTKDQLQTSDKSTNLSKDG